MGVPYWYIAAIRYCIGNGAILAVSGGKREGGGGGRREEREGSCTLLQLAMGCTYVDVQSKGDGRS